MILNVLFPLSCTPFHTGFLKCGQHRTIGFELSPALPPPVQQEVSNPPQGFQPCSQRHSKAGLGTRNVVSPASGSAFALQQPGRETWQTAKILSKNIMVGYRVSVRPWANTASHEKWVSITKTLLFSHENWPDDPTGHCQEARRWKTFHNMKQVMLSLATNSHPQNGPENQDQIHPNLRCGNLNTAMCFKIIVVLFLRTIRVLFRSFYLSNMNCLFSIIQPPCPYAVICLFLLPLLPKGDVHVWNVPFNIRMLP